MLRARLVLGLDSGGRSVKPVIGRRENGRVRHAELPRVTSPLRTVFEA